jgi:predicted O-methyltransferase YrrM
VYEAIGPLEGGSSPERCTQLYDFVRERRPGRCLELGFAHGISTCYIAAALEANGAGSLTSVDNLSALERDPSAEELLARTGLRHRVELVHGRTSYTWYLRGVLRERLRGGAIEPLFDFCFLDGAHSWEVDGLALLLVERLLRPGGTVVMDDLTWRFDERWPDMPPEERALPHMTEVLDLLAAPNPAFDEVRTDGDWAWLRKSATATPAVRTVTRQDWTGPVRSAARVAIAQVRRAVGRPAATSRADARPKLRA